MFKGLRKPMFLIIASIFIYFNYTNVFAITDAQFTPGGGFVMGKIVSSDSQGEYTLISDNNNNVLIHTTQWAEYQQLLASGYPEVIKYEVIKNNNSYKITHYQLLGQARVKIDKSKQIEVTDEYNCDQLSILKFVIGTYGEEYLYNKNPNEMEISEPVAVPKKEKQNSGKSSSGKAKGSKTSNKKGALLMYDADEIIDLGCSQVAINYTLGTKSGHLEMAKQLHKKGIKITLIVTSNIPLNEDTLGSNPAPYNNPILYMPDLTDSDVRSAFNEMLKDWSGIVDNYVIGNEIGDQTYCYYKPCYVDEYVKAYCQSFKMAYNAIKSKKGSAKVFIPFDQSWNMPALSKTSSGYDANLSRFKYNSKEMLQLIRKEIGNNIDWGVAAHPYPDPLTSAVFWDDNYATNDPNSMVVTMNNIEVMCDFLASSEMKKANGSPREILISEIGFSDNDGYEIAAGALMYAWTKIENNNQIIGFLYNISDFPLNDEVEKVFKTMDTSSREEAVEIMERVKNNASANASSSLSSENVTDSNLNANSVNAFGGKGIKMVSQRIETDEDGNKSRIVVFSDGSEDWYDINDAYVVAENEDADGFTYRSYSDGKITKTYTWQIKEVLKMIREKKNVCGGWKSKINADGTRTFSELKYKPTGEWIKIANGELVIGPNDSIQYQANMYLIKKFSLQ